MLIVDNSNMKIKNYLGEMFIIWYMHCDIAPFFCELQDVEFLLLFYEKQCNTKRKKMMVYTRFNMKATQQIFMNACTISNAQERLRYTTFSIPYKLPAEKKNSEDTYLYTWIENAKPIWNHFLLDSLWCACILCGNKGSVLNYGYNKGYRVSVGLSIEFSILCASLWRQSSSVKE